MASESSDEWLDQPSERFEFDNYSLSADVSESESSSSTTSFSCDRRQDHPGASTSYTDYSVSPAPLPEMLSVVDGIGDVGNSPLSDLSEVELMKERFAKLLLGEDMSGGGKGVGTALAISNAITNLSASVFGELWKLEPLAPLKKKMWRREMEWLLCVSDSIVELVPSTQELPGGGTFEIMVPRPRSDLYVNLPALKKLDAMLLSILDGFCGSEFYYVDRGITVSGNNNEDGTFPMPPSSSGRPSVRQEEKWWLPFPKVPRDGLSEDTRKRLQQCRECTHQILKAAMAINSNVLAEMEVPRAYLDSLPKTGKACLGEIMYRYITANNFSPNYLLDYTDLSSEYTTLEMANRIEAAANIWRKKNSESNKGHAKAGRSSWRGRVKGFVGEIPNRKLLAKRADILLQNLRLRFPGLPQTTLDMSKIQHNKDVGHAIIESYSRVMESLAFNTMARIDDLLYVDDATKQYCRKQPESTCSCGIGRFGGSLARQKRISPASAPSLRVSALDPSNEVTKVLKGKGTQFHKD